MLYFTCVLKVSAYQPDRISFLFSYKISTYSFIQAEHSLYVNIKVKDRSLQFSDRYIGRVLSNLPYTAGNFSTSELKITELL